jgi:NAD(P)-dependent dehydrogenase (short-subunit alcohol dehydrogenase family)
MQESGKGGSIVVTASLASIEAFPTIGAYNASKSAARAIMHIAAREYAEHGIRVNCVSPGYTATPMVQAWGNLEERLKSVPLGT